MILTSVWTQITTGKETRFVQSESHQFAICSSDVEPSVDQPYHVIEGGAVIQPPTVAWIRALYPAQIEITIT